MSRIAPKGEIRRGLLGLALVVLAALPVVLALELALVFLAMAGFPVLEYLLPPSWLASLAGGD